MEEPCLLLPEQYLNKLDIMDTEKAIKLVKDSFERKLAEQLSLQRVSAPLFVAPDSGLNDNLNGVERPVSFDIPAMSSEYEIVHSLAKWKRMALKRYGFRPGTGLYTDMNAIRRDEALDNLHSVYVDQWDWEVVLTPEARNEATLRQTAQKIISALCRTQEELSRQFPAIEVFLKEEVTFITTQEMEDRYPSLSPKERENAVAREYGTVFILQIGDKLRSGKPHDGRAPDYDDWQLNGDLLVWYPLLGCAIELSSMGIRVDEAVLRSQLEKSGCTSRAALPFHRELLAGRLPLTMGGGIGQSRLCMVLLQKAHIGEVQASVWPAETLEHCAACGIMLL